MKRRPWLVSVCSMAVLAATAARARGQHVPRIALLPEFGGAAFRGYFAAAFREQGWEEGRDYVLLELGTVYAASEVDSAARKALDATPDLIITINTAYAVAAQRLTRTIPIVMFASGYPVEIGLVQALARPGGNVTGNVSYAGAGIWGKMLELLRVARPGIRRVAVLYDYLPPMNPREESEQVFAELDRAASTLKLALHMVEVPLPEKLSGALTSVRTAGCDALMFTSGATLWQGRQQILQFALELRLPTVTDGQSVGRDGMLPLITYGRWPSEMFGGAAHYAMRILRDGAKPGELPLLQPKRYDLVISARTAKAIGLALPPALRIAATEVVD